MGTANIHDRASLEQLYPLKAFTRDAAQNSRTETEVRHGIRIGSAPDDTGDFTLECAARHAAEAPNVAFLAANRRGETGNARQEYDAFLDHIVERAQRHGYRAAISPGPGDRRIKGLRQ